MRFNYNECRMTSGRTLNTNWLGLQASLSKRLLANPNSVYDELCEVSEPSIDDAELKRWCDELHELLKSQRDKQECRNKLSREIGKRKKNAEDSSDLIAEVKALSRDIDCLNESIKTIFLDMKLAIFSNEDDVGGSNCKPTVPAHLAPTDIYDAVDTNHDQYLHLKLAYSASVDPEEWQDYIQASVRSTIYHDFRWKQIIESNFKQKMYYVTCRNREDQLVGVLPLIHMKSRIFGSFTISMPYFNYGGPLGDSIEIEESLIQHGAALSGELGCSHMEVRETKKRESMESISRKVSMILPLPVNDDVLEKQLGSKLRAQVKKSKSNGLTVQFGGRELLDQFYHVFSLNMRDLGTPVYSKQFFGDILDSFPMSAFISVVFKDGRSLAAGFLIGYRDKLEIPWASSIRSQNHLGANMFLYRSILREAVSRDYRFFDFGRSTIGANTHRFKKQWGAQEYPLHWHYWTQEGASLPGLNPDNPKFKLAIGVWRRLPIYVTRKLGPMIAQNLP